MEFKLEGDTTDKVIQNMVVNMNQPTEYDNQEC